MKHIADEQLDIVLNIFQTMKEVQSPDYFYAKLYARLEKKYSTDTIQMLMKPLLIICTLTFILFLNSILFEKEQMLSNASTRQNMQALAESYDQLIPN